MSVSAGELPPHVTVETVVGRMALPAHDRVMTPWISENRSWEPAESAVLTALIRRGDSVVDVGAHAGYMTLLAARRVGPEGAVLAVEAHPGNYSLLQHNVLGNGHANVRTVRGAAWRRSGETRILTVSDENSGDHRVYRRSGAAETLEVRSVAVDDLLDPGTPVDVVKIDTQGTDHVAIEGMRRTLERWRPIVVCEFWPPGIEEFGDVPEGVVAGYRALGYEVSMLEDPGLPQDAPPEEVVARARASHGEFCTLVLHPGESGGERALTERVSRLLARGPAPAPGVARSPLRKTARRTILRVMKPYTAYQDMVNEELLQALEQLSRRIESVPRRHR